MGSPATGGQRSGRCTCGRDLDAVAALLREALRKVEGPRTYEQGLAEWARQTRNQRTQRPQQRASAAIGPSTPTAAAPPAH